MAGRTRGILALARSQPWPILQEKLDAILDVLEMRAEGLTFSAEDIQARVGQGMRGAKQAPVGGRIAVLPIYGIIAQRMNLMTDISGGTSTEEFAQAFTAAVDNPEVSAIVFDVDSPGGTISGVPELAAMIRAARGKKPIYAVANTMMASAAYWLAAQADEIIASPSSLVGSIGAVMVHTDQSEANAKAGVKRTYITSSPYKAEGNRDEPLGDEAKEAIKAMVDDADDLFIKDLAAGRGLTPAAVRANYGKGRVMTASQAKEAGLVDRVQSLDDLLSDLTGGARGSPPKRTRASTDLTIAALAPGGDLVSTTEQITALQPTAAGGPAVVLLSPTPSVTTPAPKAKEHTVSEITTAAPNGADMSDVERLRAFNQLAKDHNKGTDAALSWFDAGKSVAQVKDEIMAEYRAGARPLRADPSITVGKDLAAEKPFASLGEQLQAIANAGRGRGIDPRLSRINAAASGGQSHVGADGGFLIQHQFIADLTKDAFEEGQLLSRCDNTDLGENSNGLSVVYNKETSRATGSRWGGVRVYNVDEAETATASKPGVDKWQLELGKKMGIAYMTEELLQDAPAMSDVYSKAFSAEFAFVCDNEVFRGIGGAQFTGVLPNDAVPSSGHPAISVSKETGQLAATIEADNIAKMWARVHPRSKAKGAWFVNTETFPQLSKLQVGTGTSGQLVYMPPGGLSTSPYGTLYGRPVIEIEYAAALGTIGDISFLDLSKYKTITKGGVRPSESMHVRFLYDEMTFKWTYRINGAPKDKAPLTPFKGSGTLSPFVFLATRA